MVSHHIFSSASGFFCKKMQGSVGTICKEMIIEKYVMKPFIRFAEFTAVPSLLF